MARNDPLEVAIDLQTPGTTHDAEAATDFSLYAAALTKNPPDRDAHRASKALALGLGDVLGVAMSADAKAQAPNLEAMRWPGKRPSPDVMRRIERASLVPERKGEAILLILDNAHSIGLRDLAPDVTVEFVRILNQMGLADAARAIAIEALELYAEPPEAPTGAPVTAP